MMTNQIKIVDEEWHVASDWCRAYQLQEGVDISHARAVCKFRDDMDNILAVADCHIQDNVIVVEVLGRTNNNVYPFVKKGRYDVFIIIGEHQYKVVMGKLTIIHDVSMH